MAFFPLFIDPATQRGVITFGAMAATIAALTLVYCLTLVAFASALTARSRRIGALARLLERLAGFVLVASDCGWRSDRVWLAVAFPVMGDHRDRGGRHTTGSSLNGAHLLRREPEGWRR